MPAPASKNSKKSKKSKKSESALRQNKLSVKKASEEGSGLCFLSVQAARGNGYFTLRKEDGREITGTPRGLFTSGSMRISVGQIVVVDGIPEDQSKIKDHPYEIVGVVQERSEARELIKSGRMSKKVLTFALSAGALTQAPEDGMAETLDDLFEDGPGEDIDFDDL